jgi:signal transduction histidine kinase
MKKLSENKIDKKHRRIRISLRIHFALMAIATLCFSCIISYIVVKSGVKLFYNGDVTIQVAILMCFLACIMTMVLGGILLWIGTAHFIRPIIEISNAVKKISEGDFTVKIKRNEKLRGNYNYSNEIDELAENFNKMSAELNGMDYMRKDFMSNVSHEVKTPVASITGFTEILMDGGLSEEEEKEYLGYVYNESVRLSKLCENMLSLSRLDNQSIVNKNKEFSLDEQLRKCIIMLSEKWTDRENYFDLQLEKVTIKSNYDLLYQVWTNLIDNSIKYSRPKSTIKVRLICMGDSAEVTIDDEGIGIPKEKMDRIFEKFYQCEESHKNLGNGLGLSIVKRILELLGCEISYESKIDKGTKMTILIHK